MMSNLDAILYVLLVICSFLRLINQIYRWLVNVTDYS